MVPKFLRDRVWETYQLGQEAGAVRPSSAWHDAADAAIASIKDRAVREGGK